MRKAIFIIAAIYLIGVIATFAFNRLMVVISQSILKKIRDDMFDHMQEFPIKYFDTHSHGDIMSHFTNDTDTLRQMLSQSIPMVFSSIITIIAVFIAMISLSVHLTVIVLLALSVMIFVAKKIGGKSGEYFIRQQTSLGKTNGFIEEMISGQKVVKVFNHEEEAKKQFDRLNEELFENATEAHRFANILMPVMGNIGNIQYVIISIFGGALAVFGIGGVTLGTIASFLQLSRTFSGPVSRVSQQLNFIVLALAGAKRIFNLMDQPVEEDSGTITLVRAKYENGELKETDTNSGLWAWKIPHEDGTVSFKPLQGDVRFHNVHFGYTEDKRCCTISICMPNRDKKWLSSARPEPEKQRLQT